MKTLLLTLFMFLATLEPNYEVEYSQSGLGIHCAVIYGSERGVNYVVTSDEKILYGIEIIDLFGIQHGGTVKMEYIYGQNKRVMDVTVIDEKTAFHNARSTCRSETRRNF